MVEESTDIACRTVRVVILHFRSVARERSSPTALEEALRPKPIIGVTPVTDRARVRTDYLILLLGSMLGSAQGEPHLTASRPSGSLVIPGSDDPRSRSDLIAILWKSTFVFSIETQRASQYVVSPVAALVHNLIPELT